MAWCRTLSQVSATHLKSCRWYLRMPDLQRIYRDLTTWKDTVIVTTATKILIHIMVCWLFTVKPLSEPMVYCQLDTWNKHQWNFNRNWIFFTEENTFESVACNMMAILFLLLCDKPVLQYSIPFPSFIYFMHFVYFIGRTGPKAVTWTYYDILLVRFCGIHLRSENNFIASDVATILLN